MDGVIGEGLVFLEHFRSLLDPRQPGKVVYPLDEILLLCLLAVLAGAETFTDIARFGTKKLDLLRSFRPFRDRTPAYDHLGDIFATLDADKFQQCFVAWVAAQTGVTADVIAIDGKTVRRSGDKKGGKAAVHMVSAFATRQRLALGQVKVAEKSNEIVAIPHLLDMMSVEGAVVTIDAMGCQRGIATFLDRPLEGDWPYVWLDATYVKVRQDGRIVSVAVTIAGGANTAGRREVLGMDIGPSEAETFWTDFLRKLARRGLRGVKLVVSDAHEGLKAAIAKVLNATWQCCRVHFMRNVLAHAGKQGRRVVSAFIGTAFAQDTAQAARTQWRQVADQLRPRARKLAELMEVVGIFPNEAAITRLIGAILPEPNDEWAIQRSRYLTLESVAPLGHDPLTSLPPVAAA